EESDKIYRQLLEKTPDDTDVLASFGLSQIGQTKLEDAAKTFETLLKQPDVPENLQVLGKTQLAYIALQRGQYAAAIDAVKPLMIFKDRVNAQAINIALDAMKKQKRWSDAVALLQPLVDKFAGDPYVNARYIEMLARAGEKDRARVAAATQTKFGVKNSIAAAEAFIQAEQYDVALGVLRDALRTKPDDVDLQFELGSVYERAGDKAAAEKYLADATRLLPRDATVHEHLGDVLAKRGDAHRALSMYRAALTLDPETKDLDKIRSKIAELEKQQQAQKAVTPR